MPLRLRELRQERGWSQARLSMRSGIYVNTIAKYEQGLNYPSLPTLEKLAQALGVTVAELEGEPEVKTVLRLDLSMDRVPPYWQTDDEGNLIRWRIK